MNIAPLDVVSTVFEYIEEPEEFCDALNVMQLELKQLKKKFSLKLTDDNIHLLKHLQDLHSIDLSCCKSLKYGCVFLSKIKHIDLTDCRSIDDDCLKYLSEAISIDLSSCNLITSEGIKYLKNVEKLNLYGCKRIFPNTFEHFKNLKSISLDCTRFPSHHMNDFKYLENVEEICLSDAFRVKNPIFTHLKNLKILDFDECDSIGYDGFKYIPNIHTLKLRDGINIEDGDLKDFNNLIHVQLNDCGISDKFGQKLINCHTIHLCYCHSITDDILKYFHSVIDLELRNVPITDKGIQNLLENKKNWIFKNLNLSSLLITDESIKYFKNVDHIEVLSLNNLTGQNFDCLPSNIDEAYLHCDLYNLDLKYFKNTKRISMNRCPYINDDGLSYLIDAEYLNIDGTKNINGSFMQNLRKCQELYLQNCHIKRKYLQYFDNIKILTLIKCEIYQDEYQFADEEHKDCIGFRHLKNLKKISLRDCYIYDDFLEEIGTVPNIKIIIDETPFTSLNALKYLRSVKKLSISFNNQICDHHIICLDNVSNLNIAYCEDITDKAVSCFTNVRTLNISGCPKITYDGIKKLKNLERICIDKKNFSEKDIQEMENKGICVFE
jgi:hypothetical protein